MARLYRTVESFDAKKALKLMRVLGFEGIATDYPGESISVRACSYAAIPNTYGHPAVEVYYRPERKRLEIRTPREICKREST